MRMRNRSRFVVVVLALSLGLGALAQAQGGTVVVKEEKKGMLKQAKVTADAAIKTAQGQFPNGTIKSGEIEKEDGKLIFTFDIQQPGVKGIEEVNIDAMTGTILKTEHENPAPPKPKKNKPPKTKPPTD